MRAAADGHVLARVPGPIPQRVEVLACPADYARSPGAQKAPEGTSGRCPGQRAVPRARGGGVDLGRAAQSSSRAHRPGSVAVHTCAFVAIRESGARSGSRRGEEQRVERVCVALSDAGTAAPCATVTHRGTDRSICATGPSLLVRCARSSSSTHDARRVVGQPPPAEQPAIQLAMVYTPETKPRSESPVLASMHRFGLAVHDPRRIRRRRGTPVEPQHCLQPHRHRAAPPGPDGAAPRRTLAHVPRARRR
jgi:hypothetical protein